MDFSLFTQLDVDVLLVLRAAEPEGIFSCIDDDSFEYVAVHVGCTEVWISKCFRSTGEWLT